MTDGDGMETVSGITPRMSRRTKLLIPVGLAVAVFLVYGPALTGGFIAFDDHAVVAESVSHSLAEIWTGPVYDAWLPVYYTAIKAQAWIFGADGAGGMHVVSVLLHILNSLLVLLIVWRIAKRLSLAGGVAFLFALHPGATESVAWISEQKGLLAFAFAALAILSFLAAIDRKGLSRLGLHALGLALLALGMLAKGSVLPVPLVLLLLVAVTRWSERGRRWWFDLAPWLALSVFFAVLHYRVALAEGPAHAADGTEVLPVVLADFAVAGRYLRTLFLPVYGQSLVPDLRPATGFFETRILIGLLISALYVAALVVSFRKSRPLFFALGAVALAMAPYNNLLPRTTVLFAERYLYLALPAAALVFALVAGRFGRKGLGALAGVGVLFAVLTVLRCALWSDPVEIFRDASRKAGDSWLVAAKLGDALKLKAERAQAEGGDAGAAITEAVGVFEDAVARAPGAAEEVRSRIDLAGALLVTGDGGAAAVAVLDPAVALLPSVDPRRRTPLSLEVHLNRGTALSLLGRDSESADAYRAAARAAPSDARPVTGLAVAYSRLGDLDNAIATAGEAVILDPDDEGAVVALAEAFYLKAKPGDAMNVLADHLERHPRALRAMCLLGELSLTAGRPADAEKRFAAALEISPGHRRASRGLGSAGLLLAKDALFKGNREQAVAWAGAAMRANPSDPAAAVFLAEVVEDPARAEALLIAASKLEGGVGARDVLAAMRIRQALGLLDAGDRAGAAHGAVRALESYSRKIDLHAGIVLKDELSALRSGIEDPDLPGREELLVGLALLAAGRFEDASTELFASYREAVNAGASGGLSRLALLLRGRARLENGQRDEAVADFRLLTDLAPEDPTPLIMLADALTRSALEEKSAALAEGREPMTEALFDQARAAAEKAVQLAPGEMAPLLRLGEIEFAAENYLDALAKFSRARREHPDRVEPMLDLAGLYKTHYLLTEEDQYLSGAIKEMEQALSMDPGDAKARAALGELLFMAGQARRAAQELARAVGEDRSLLQARVVLATLYVRSGRSRLDGGGKEAPEQAGRFAQLALALDTGQAGPHLLMADVLRVKKDFGPAQEHLERARLIDENSMEVKDGIARYHKDLGFAYLLAGRKEEARAQFTKAVDAGSENVDLNQVRSILTRGEEVEAPPETPLDPEYEAIFKERTERARLAFMSAVKLQAEGDFDGAASAIIESLTALETAEARYVLGQIRQDQKKTEEAERAFRAAVKLKPALHQAWLDLGSLLYFKGDDAGALECYENYLALSGDEAPLETRAAVEVKVKEIRAALSERDR
jgi:protein O-mannosyl-transferase